MRHVQNWEIQPFSTTLFCSKRIIIDTGASGKCYVDDYVLAVQMVPADLFDTQRVTVEQNMVKRRTPIYNTYEQNLVCLLTLR